VAAGLRSGLLGDMGNCSKCDINPKLKDAWGCRKPAAMRRPTFNDIIGKVHYRYRSCPKCFVPVVVWDFIEYMDWCEKFRVSMPRPENVSARFYQAWQFYEAKFAECLDNKKDEDDK